MYKEFSIPSYTRELFVYRIINGYLKYNNLEIRSPTKKCLYESQIVYVDTYKKAIENEVICEDELLDLMLEIGAWTEEDTKQLTDVLPKHIEYFQKQIYHCFYHKNELNQTYLYLNRAKKEVSDLYNKKTQYNYLTAEGLAIFAKLQYIIENSTFEDDKRCDWDKYDIKTIMVYLNDNYIDDTILRYLARNHPWSDIWSVSKKTGALFDISADSLNDDQKRLVGWSTMYDNIREYDDCPDDDIIRCDDALDGWLILKRDEKKRGKELDGAENRLGAARNSEEIFVVASGKDPHKPITKEEAKEIYNLNSQMARGIVKSRLDTVARLGIAKDTDMPDIRQKLRMMQTNNEMGR